MICCMAYLPLVIIGVSFFCNLLSTSYLEPHSTRNMRPRDPSLWKRDIRQHTQKQGLSLQMLDFSSHIGRFILSMCTIPQMLRNNYISAWILHNLRTHLKCSNILEFLSTIQWSVSNVWMMGCHFVHSQYSSLNNEWLQNKFCVRDLY